MSQREQPRTDGPPVAECRLDLAGLRAQRERYRTLGREVTTIARRSCALEIRFSANLDVDLLDETLAVERECCPFFGLEYDARSHRLSVSVEPEHEPALEAIAYAFLGGAPEGVRRIRRRHPALSR